MSCNQIEFPADVSALQDIFTWVSRKLEAIAFSPKKKSQVELVMEELVVNIIHHAYGKEEGRLKLAFSVNRDQVSFTVTDWGEPFDPTKTPQLPAVDTPLNQRQPGGLGLHLTHELSNQLSYHRDDECNHLTVTFWEKK